MRDKELQRTHKITVLVSEDEHDMVTDMAHDAGFASVASYIRAVLLLEEGYYKQMLQQLPRPRSKQHSPR